MKKNHKPVIWEGNFETLKIARRWFASRLIMKGQYATIHAKAVPRTIHLLVSRILTGNLASG